LRKIVLIVAFSFFSYFIHAQVFNLKETGTYYVYNKNIQKISYLYFYHAFFLKDYLILEPVYSSDVWFFDKNKRKMIKTFNYDDTILYAFQLKNRILIIGFYKIYVYDIELNILEINNTIKGIEGFEYKDTNNVKYNTSGMRTVSIVVDKICFDFTIAETIPQKDLSFRCYAETAGELIVSIDNMGDYK
jgi:hypothetical protein